MRPPVALTSAEITVAMSRLDRAWFELAGMGGAYIRRSFRRIDGFPYHALDLANVEVLEPYRNQGVFSEVVTCVIAAAYRLQKDCVYVEAIHNPIVTTALVKRGFRLRSICDGMQWDAYKLLYV
jgi:GNAT superfamily N-acetyltransferase